MIDEKTRVPNRLRVHGLNVPATKTKLLRLRKDHGHASPAGHRSSNLMELLDQVPVSPAHAKQLQANIQKQFGDLARLTA